MRLLTYLGTAVVAVGIAHASIESDTTYSETHVTDTTYPQPPAAHTTFTQTHASSTTSSQTHATSTTMTQTHAASTTKSQTHAASTTKTKKTKPLKPCLPTARIANTTESQAPAGNTTLTCLPHQNHGAANTTNPDAQGACVPMRGGADACGPNGSEAWLNTGLDGDGWTPPYLDIKKLSHLTLEQFYKGIGQRCEMQDKYFRLPGRQYKIPPVILAVLAWQETNCWHRHGKGLFRCAPGTCKTGKKKKCLYPLGDNAECAARNLRRWLDESNDNAVYALGMYGGLFTDNAGHNDNRSITPSYPCSKEGFQKADWGKIRNYEFKKSRNMHVINLSYLHETLNGWLQGTNMTRKDSLHLRGNYKCTGNCTGNNLC